MGVPESRDSVWLAQSRAKCKLSTDRHPLGSNGEKAMSPDKKKRRGEKRITELKRNKSSKREGKKKEEEMGIGMAGKLRGQGGRSRNPPPGRKTKR